ncbi:Smr/MutS family protein [Paraflavisolibacter sp. H34]|uniref:Smr/MutS family protein n=1 Tax=Huijunlia imazamoxiresistens TaxID=3127457 RepID=UPI0030197899
MKFQIGDKVLVLHSNEEGEVVEIINNKMVLVEVRGVKFPAYIDQLDFPYFKRFSENKPAPKKAPKMFVENLKPEKKQPKVADGVWITFLPVFDMDEFGDDYVQELKVHVVNRTVRSLNFIYRLQFYGKTEFELKNQLGSFSDFYLHDIPFEDVSDSPAFAFEFSLQQPEKGKADFFEASVKLKPKQLFQRIEEIRQKGEATFSYRLFEHYPNKVEEEKFDMSSLAAKGIKVYSAKEARRHLPPARTVVDLHIEKLNEEWQRLSNGEILDIQLREFEKWYELAVAHRQPHLIVIHGVGTGRLRDEIHDALRLKREVKTFVNQYNASFGYGATEIYFQY